MAAILHYGGPCRDSLNQTVHLQAIFKILSSFRRVCAAEGRGSCSRGAAAISSTLQSYANLLQVTILPLPATTHHAMFTPLLARLHCDFPSGVISEREIKRLGLINDCEVTQGVCGDCKVGSGNESIRNRPSGVQVSTEHIENINLRQWLPRKYGAMHRYGMNFSPSVSSFGIVAAITTDVLHLQHLVKE